MKVPLLPFLVFAFISLYLTTFAQSDTVKWQGKSYLNIPYKTVGKRQLLMDIYMPKDQKYNLAPLLYYVHGGGWAAGNKAKNGLPLMKPVFDLLSEQGFICVSIDYRLYKQKNNVFIRDCVTDAMDGLRFLKKNEAKYGIDSNKIVVWGDSAGGQLAQMLTYADPDKFLGDTSLSSYQFKTLAGISWYGPTDFTDVNLFKSKYSDKEPNRFGLRITGNSKDYSENKEAYEEVSPYYWIKKTSPPLFLIHGDRDPTIPHAHSLHLKEKADQFGADVSMVIVKNSAHNWKRSGGKIEPSLDKIQKLTAEFALKQINKDQE
ncbi:MAG: alpha/beta hydrolase [Lentisphaeraceae bacterium]|nr:alpha/beta hydrolase [Lentisphaeraceae bacterium]